MADTKTQETEMVRFLRRHDHVYEAAPPTWDEGLPLANGSMGTVVWGDGNPLNFTMGCCELWDLREPKFNDPRFSYANFKKLFRQGRIEETRNLFDFRLTEIAPTRLPGPRMELSFGSAPTAYEARLNLATATAAGRISFGKKAANWEAYVASDRDLLVVRVLAGNHPRPKLRARLDHLSPAAQAEMKRRSMPPSEQGRQGSVSWLYQPIPENGGCLLAWREIAQEGNGALFLVTLKKGEDRATLLDAASEFLRDAAASLPAIRRNHVNYWRGYWGKSWLTIPDRRLESLYYAEIYKFGCCSKPGKFAIALQGPWNVDGDMPDWQGEYACDLNVQLSYWPAYASNRLEYTEPLHAWVNHILPRLREEGRKFLGRDVPFGPCASALNGERIYGWVTCEQWPGSGPWLAWHFWLYYLYSRDEEFLKSTAYPVMREFMNMYSVILEKGKDGRYHVPLSTSPEYSHDGPGAWGKDTACDLALVRALGEALIYCVKRFGLADADSRRWADILAHLAPYPSAATGTPGLAARWEKMRNKIGMPNDPWLVELPARTLYVMHNVPYYCSHPHLTHLLALYPLGLLSIEGGDEEKAVVLDSIQNLWHFGMGRWAGQNIGWASCLASRARMPEMALHMLQEYADHFITRNTFNVNGDYRLTGASAYTLRTVTLESGFAYAGAVMEMLLQGWGGKIRVFTGVPTEWRNVSFRDLRAEGAFLVSAARQQGETRWVRIQSEKGLPCTLVNPFPCQPVVLEDTTSRKRRLLRGDLLKFSTKAGHSYLLYYNAPAKRDMQMTPAPAPRLRENPYGVKALDSAS
jgi:alpha-L-fucosidase 2